MMSRAWGASDKDVDSVRLDRVCSAVKTNRGGLEDGQRLESIAGNADAECNGEMNGGPPMQVSAM